MTIMRTSGHLSSGGVRAYMHDSIDKKRKTAAMLQLTDDGDKGKEKEVPRKKHKVMDAPIWPPCEVLDKDLASEIWKKELEDAIDAMPPSFWDLGSSEAPILVEDPPEPPVPVVEPAAPPTVSVINYCCLM